MTVTRRREWTGGIKRLREIYPAPFGKTPPVAGYRSWYDADDLSVFTLLGGSGVSVWADKGSGGNSLSAFSDVRSPCLARHPSLFRGRFAVRFSGGGTSQGTGVGSSASASARIQTAFVIAVLETLTPTATLMGSNADGGNRFKVDTSGFLTTDRADVAAVGAQSNASVSVGVPFLAVQVLTATDVTHILNGVSETDSDSNAFTASRTLQLGNSVSIGTGNAALTGWIAEVLIYDTTLNGTDISTVSAWLRSKWDV